MTTPVLFRRQVRLAIMAALQAGLAGVTVESPPVTATAPKQLPYVGVRCGTERKAAVGKRQPLYTTTAPIEILVRVSASTEGAAQDQLEAQCCLVERLVLGSPDVIALVQQMNVTSTTEFNAEGSTCQAEAVIAIDCEGFEKFDPVEINPDAYPPLQGVNLHVDTVRPFDANGIYAASPFPDKVAAAPRSAGPDGRDEGVLNIDLPQ